MDDIKELSAAMAKASPLIEGALKDKVNPAFRSKYADLAAVTDAIKPHLESFGLWYRQVAHHKDGWAGVETVIHHSSGQSLGCGVVFVPVTKQDAQGYGSALTYARRYSLMAAFGVPAEDDDANGAVSRTQKPMATEREVRIRKVADECIRLHGIADVMLEKEGDNRGFWALYDYAKPLQGEDRELLWAYLKEHSKIRSALKQYREYDLAEQAKHSAQAA